MPTVKAKTTRKPAAKVAATKTTAQSAGMAGANPYEPADSQLRMMALDHAARLGLNAAGVVDAAEKYYAFLRGK